MGMLLRLHKLGDSPHENKAAPKKEVKVEPEIKKETVVETTATEKPKFSRSQIQLMPVAGLKEVAKEYGVEDYMNKSGSKLKKELLEIMGL